jgi:hypothetical protein
MAELLVQALLSTWDAALEVLSHAKSLSESEPKIVPSVDFLQKKMELLDTLLGGSAGTKLLDYWDDLPVQSTGERSFSESISLQSSERRTADLKMVIGGSQSVEEADEFGCKSTALWWKSVMNGISDQTNQSITSTWTVETMKTAISSFAAASVTMLLSIINSQQHSLSGNWSSDYWNLASLLLTLTKGITNYARSANCELFSVSSVRNNWGDCLQLSPAITDIVERHIGDWRDSKEVLLVEDSLSGHPPPRKEKGQRVAGCLKGGSGERGWSDPSDGNGGGMVEVGGTSGRGDGDGGIDGAGESVPFTTSSHGSYDEGIGTLRSNGGDIGGGSETIIAHAVTCHHAKGGDPTTDNYLVTGGFFDSPIGTMACNTGPNGHDAGNFQSNQGVDSGYVIPVAYGFSGESDGSTVRNASDMARTITNRHGDPGFVAIQNATRGQDQNGLGISEDGTMYTLDQGSQHAVAWHIQDQNTGKSIKAKPSEISTCLGTRDLSKYQGTFNADVIQSVMQVRRLTPVECSRLQGVPDLYLDITYRGKPLADGLKYKLLGNGFAVPCVFWIGKRIQMVEELINGIS